MILILLLLVLSQAAIFQKGVGSTSLNNCSDLEKLNIGWWYNWGLDPGRCHTKQFIPMVWGRTFVPDIPKVDKSAPALLGFNEPNVGGQADMSPQEAASYWPQLEATNMRLGSPGVTSGDDGTAWLDQFFSNCTGCRVDFIAFHWYEPWSGSCDPNILAHWINVFATRYKRPVWLTEFDCADGSYEENLKFMKGLPNIIKSNPQLEAYAWFTTRKGNYFPPYYQHINLCTDQGGLTELGVYYASL